MLYQSHRDESCVINIVADTSLSQGDLYVCLRVRAQPFVTYRTRELCILLSTEFFFYYYHQSFTYRNSQDTIEI